jgi:hypothetical protein
MIFQFRQLFNLCEASYRGNLGFMELTQFMSKARREDPKLFQKVQELIAKDDQRAVWKIVQDYLDVQLVGKEFH